MPKKTVVGTSVSSVVFTRQEVRDLLLARAQELDPSITPPDFGDGEADSEDLAVVVYDTGFQRELIGVDEGVRLRLTDEELGEEVNL